MSKDSRFFSAVRSIAGMIGEKHVTTHAAAADYHLVIALPPAMMLLISLIRFLPVTQEEVLQRFSETMPEQVYSILESIVGSIFNSTETVTIISAVLPCGRGLQFNTSIFMVSSCRSFIRMRS